MIESGSLTPGVNPADWGLPPGTALRYEKPAGALKPYFPSYAVLDSDRAVFKGPNSWILPSAAQIWIVLAEAPVKIGARRRPLSQLGTAVLFGPSSTAMPVESRGGVSIVVDVSPIGWARLVGSNANTLCDKIEPLAGYLGTAWTQALVSRLHQSDRAHEVKSVLDDMLMRRLPPATTDEVLIARAHDALLRCVSLAAAAAETGVTSRALLTLCNRYWGFPPKVLMRRFRFLRSLSRMLGDAFQPDFSAPPPGYHDIPHFLRDGNLFLGMTPRRFLTLPMPYLRAGLRARDAVLGAPIPMLDRLSPSIDFTVAASQAPDATPSFIVDERKAVA